MVAAPSAAAAVTGVLQSSVVPLIAAASGVAEPGSVDAPAWVLPVGALAVILTAGLIPLLLKVCMFCFPLLLYMLTQRRNNPVYACMHHKCLLLSSQFWIYC